MSSYNNADSITPLSGNDEDPRALPDFSGLRVGDTVLVVHEDNHRQDAKPTERDARVLKVGQQWAYTTAGRFRLRTGWFDAGAYSPTTRAYRSRSEWASALWQKASARAFARIVSNKFRFEASAPNVERAADLLDFGDEFRRVRDELLKPSERKA